jgi:hypothetical protein
MNWGIIMRFFSFSIPAFVKGRKHKKEDEKRAQFSLSELEKSVYQMPNDRYVPVVTPKAPLPIHHMSCDEYRRYVDYILFGPHGPLGYIPGKMEHEANLEIEKFRRRKGEV